MAWTNRTRGHRVGRRDTGRKISDPEARDGPIVGDFVIEGMRLPRNGGEDA